jgi:hypothetical protein
VVTTAIEKECKRSVQIGQLEHIGHHEMRLYSGGAGAPLRLLDCQRRQVDTSHRKALLREPDTVGSRATANFQSATRLNRGSTKNTL